jgi:type IV pilus assembly protein PilO
MNMSLRGALVLLIVIGMPVAAYFLVFRAQNAAIEKARHDVEHKLGLLEKLKEETARNADLAKANEEVAATVKTIEGRLPNGKDIDGLVRQVSDIAVASGLAAPGVKSGKPLPAALYMEQPIEMEVTGTFVGFFTFIANVEKLPRITRIHDMKITGLDREDVELKAEFTLSIYFQDDKQIAAVPVTGGGK